MGKDYYRILGISRTASAEEVKRAYRKQALRWHPDKNPENKKEAEKNFKNINEAFQVLSNPQRRGIFDRFGEEGLKGQQSGGRNFTEEEMAHMFATFGDGFEHEFFSAGDPFDVFSEFFGAANPFSVDLGFGSRPGVDQRGFFPRRSRPRKRAPIKHTLAVTLEELFLGATKRVRVERARLAAPGNPRSGVVAQARVFEIPVRPGFRAGTRVTFEGDGEEAPGEIPGDVVFTLEEAPHPVFRRERDDLCMRLTISLRDALTGFTTSVQTLDGRTLHVSVFEVVHPGFVKVVEGEGMPISRKPGTRGNLRIEFDVQFPIYISEERKELIRAALP